MMAVSIIPTSSQGYISGGGWGFLTKMKKRNFEGVTGETEKVAGKKGEKEIKGRIVE